MTNRFNFVTYHKLQAHIRTTLGGDLRRLRGQYRTYYLGLSESRRNSLRRLARETVVKDRRYKAELLRTRTRSQELIDNLKEHGDMPDDESDLDLIVLALESLYNQELKDSNAIKAEREGYFKTASERLLPF